MNDSTTPDPLRQHKSKWEELAQENDRYYVRSVDHYQSDEEYEASGWENVKEFIQEDVTLCSRMSPFSDKVILEIGCGSGRMTKSLVRLFKHVVAVDVAPTMLEKATNFVRADNVTFIESDGVSASVIPGTVDLAFSYIVYQHFPSNTAVERSFCNIARALRHSGLFKVQIRGQKHPDPRHWSWGPSFDERAAIALASQAGFNVIASSGSETRSYWLLLEKN